MNALAAAWAVALLLSGLPLAVGAQQREIQRRGFGDPEGRLMAFYAAAMAFSEIGTAKPLGRWAVDAGIELTYIPRLSREQRTAGFDKPESSNLSPILPRPRLAVGLPGTIRLEASWLPPVRVFDGRANLGAIAVSRRVATWRDVSITPRLAFSGGRATGSITCNADLLAGTPSERLYYAAVCHSRESEDHFDDRQVSAEVLFAPSRGAAALTPFASVGVRHDDVRFDIGVRTAAGAQDPDHPILRMRATRPFLLAGVEWRTRRRQHVGAELYYAPGSLLTIRTRLGAGFGARQ